MTVLHRGCIAEGRPGKGDSMATRSLNLNVAIGYFDIVRMRYRGRIRMLIVCFVRNMVWRIVGLGSFPRTMKTPLQFAWIRTRVSGQRVQ